MKIIKKEISVDTTKNIELVNITDRVREFVGASKVRSGLLTIVSLHTTLSVIINENEPGLVKDFLTVQKTLINHKKFMQILEHNKLDNNAAAHLSSGIIGSSVNIIVSDGKPVFGKWQNVFIYELDGPWKSRKICMQIMGE